MHRNRVMSMLAVAVFAGTLLTGGYVSAASHAHAARGTRAAPVVAGSGTGAYKGISGSFTLTITVNEVDGQSSCHNGASVLLSQALFIYGPGTVSF
jgi:hypothetical protein